MKMAMSREDQMNFVEAVHERRIGDARKIADKYDWNITKLQMAIGNIVVQEKKNS